MAIDFHAHFIPEPLSRLLRKRRVAPWIETTAEGTEHLHMPVGVLTISTNFTDIAVRLDFMDQVGVTQQLLSFPGLFGLDSRPAAEALPLLQLFNDEVAQLAAKHPNRFIGLASLPFADMAAAATEYVRGRTNLGLAGAILPNNFFASIESANQLRPVFEAAEQYGGHLFIHPGRRPDEVEEMDRHGDSRYADNMMPRQQLEIQHDIANAMVTLMYGSFLEEYQNFTIHVANIGGTMPLVIERIDQTAKLRTLDPVVPSRRISRIHVDCSSMGPRAIEAAVGFYGADRLLLGSDCPIYRTDWTIEAIKQARISEQERMLILRGNAERLLDQL